MPPSTSAPLTAWWGTYSFDHDTMGRWRIGPSTLWVYHARREWRLLHGEEGDPMEPVSAVDLPLDPSVTDALLTGDHPEATTHRYSFERPIEQLHLAPVMPDRALVVRPDTPLFVLAGESVTLFVSTPLWIRVEVGDPPMRLQELPSHRLPDTWFGPSTREGELCYATRTAGRLRLADLPLRAHRAVTPIHVRNRADDALLLDRLQLPVQYLSIYQAPNVSLWTEAVTVERDRGGELAAVRFGRGAPPEAEFAKLLQPPRQAAHSSTVIRKVGALFGR